METTNCFFCDKPGDVVCDSPSCRHEDRELRKSLNKAHRQELRAAFFAAIRDRCKTDENVKLHRIARWFYTAKCLACVLLGWSRNHEKTPSYPDAIEVGQHHYARLYAGWEARWIEVGQGLLSQWWYELNSDGEWNM